jgi:hypothetical protein
MVLIDDKIGHEASGVFDAKDRSSLVLALGDPSDALPAESRHLYDGTRAAAIRASIFC